MATGSNSKKRFIDVHLWDQPWFVDLEPEQQLFWLYMNAKCDNIGVYAHSKRKVAFDIRCEIEGSQIEKLFNQKNQKVKAMGDDNFLLVEFCKFQHCSSSPILPKSKVFVAYMKDIRDAGLVGYFAENQPEVVSKETVRFFNAFKSGALPFKAYSDNPKKIVQNGMTEYQIALNKACEEISSMPSVSHSNDITIPLLSHQGKGPGKGAGKGVSNGIETGQYNGITSDYELSKALSEKLSPISDHETVKEIQTLAKILREQYGYDNPHELIGSVLDNLKEFYMQHELTIELLIHETKKAYLSKVNQ